eukprot:9197928-Alexandrium_andersonii.AAC.1
MFYPDKKSKLFRELWQAAEMIDVELERGHAQGGPPRVLDLLATSDILEHLLSRLGAEQAYAIHKDPVMYEELLTAKSP